MSKDQADQNATGAAGAAGVAVSAPSGAAPLLRTLGDANAAVCTDGFCEVPQPQEVPQLQEAARLQEVAPGIRATMGVDE
jgi:hypothetical protein